MSLVEIVLWKMEMGEKLKTDVKKYIFPGLLNASERA